MNKRTLRLGLLAVLSLLLFRQSQKATWQNSWPVDDFVEYWAAARLQLQGNDPYSPDQLFALQKTVGWKESSPVMMWNPPWTLMVVMPFGALSYTQARQLWLLFQLSVLFVCVALCLRIFGVPKEKHWIIWLSALLFFPFLFVLRAGQITGLVLLGITGFLFFEQKRHYTAAAAMSTLALIKPHLLYLFWIALLLWVVDRRLWRVLWAAGGVLLSAGLLPMALNSRVFYQYLEALTTQPPLDWATPTLGGILRIWLGVELSWLQFVPAIFGTGWLVFYFVCHRQSWEWTRQMPLLLLVSVFTASYGAWTYDQVVLLPALVAAIHRWAAADNKGAVIAIGSLFLSANTAAFAMNLRAINEVWFFWMAPTWLALYAAGPASRARTACV